VKELLLVGSGGHCRSCIDVVEASGDFRIAGIVSRSDLPGSQVSEYSIIGSDNDLVRLRASYGCALVAVGQITNSEPRVRLFNLLSSLDFEVASVVSPFAVVSKRSSIGRGSIVMHQAVVNSEAVIGVNVIINTAAVVEHDVVVGDHSHVSTGAIINGGARVGSGTFIGSRSVVFQEVVVGSGCIVPAGSVVFRDLQDGETWPNA
jgi:sugar O-acyltransferase (sialic acid O-acetyltransferase NeuD family)